MLRSTLTQFKAIKNGYVLKTKWITWFAQTLSILNNLFNASSWVRGPYISIWSRENAQKLKSTHIRAQLRCAHSTVLVWQLVGSQTFPTRPIPCKCSSHASTVHQLATFPCLQEYAYLTTASGTWKESEAVQILCFGNWLSIVRWLNKWQNCACYSRKDLPLTFDVLVYVYCTKERQCYGILFTHAHLNCEK